MLLGDCVYLFFWFSGICISVSCYFLRIEEIEDQFMRLPMCTGCKKIISPDGLPDQYHKVKYDETVCHQLTPDNSKCLSNSLHKAWKDCPRA